MSRLAFVVLVAAASSAVAAPHGRVVRVERAKASSNVIPILCVELRGDAGICIGAQPQVGDLIVVVDEQKTIAEVRVTAANMYLPKCDMIWSITGEVVRGDLTQSRRKSLGLIDPLLDRRSGRRIEEDKIPSPEPGSRVGFGVDRDGDGIADVLATSSSCGGSGEDCIDIWTRRDKQLSKVWSTNLRNCR
ncbi:MAG: hypothetical protein ABI867_09530 [Kofleriaceae bacterium]